MELLDQGGDITVINASALGDLQRNIFRIQLERIVKLPLFIYHIVVVQTDS